MQFFIKNLAVMIAICSATVATRSLATTYYVATTGSDSSNGSSSSPWQTIKYASTQVAGGLGHTIQVAAGTYTETGGFALRVGTNLTGAGVDQTILTGSGNVGTGIRVLIYLQSNLDNTIGQRLTGFTIDGMNRTVPSGIQVYKRHYVEIDNVKIKDVYNPGMEFKSDYSASNGSTPPADEKYIRGHKIHDNILEHCGRTNYNVTATGKYWTDWSGAITIVQDADCEIYNNTVINTNIEDGAGIKGFNSGGWHLNLRVYNNVISNARKHVEVAGDTTQWGSTASIELNRCQGDSEVYNNTVDQWTSFPNSSKGPGTWGLIFHDNTVILPAGGLGGEGIEVGSDEHIYYNYFEGFKLGITTTNPTGTTNLLVHNNVFVGRSSYSTRPLGLGNNGSNYRFYNNTFDNWLYLAYLGRSGASLTDITIQNNVVMNMSYLVNVIAGTTLTNVTFDHNLFYNWTTLRNGDQTQPITWTNNLGQTAPGVDPGLVASGSKPVPYYTAASSSSAVVDAGVVIPGITDGYVGSAPDIGAYEADVPERVSTLWTESFDSGSLDLISSAGPGTNTWQLNQTWKRSGPSSVFASGPATKSLTTLTTPGISIPPGAREIEFSFWHRHGFQENDGAVMEVSADGVTWLDVTATGSGVAFVSGGYTATIGGTGNPNNLNPLAGRQAWTGSRAEFEATFLSIGAAAYAGKKLYLRWQLGTDSSTASEGWYLDDMRLSAILTPADLFNSAASAAGLTGNNALPDATPFGDGVANLLKYAFNMKLSGPDSQRLTPGTGTSGLPAITTSGTGSAGIFRFEFIRRIGSGLIYTPKKSVDLSSGSWTDLATVPTVSPIDADWERVIYQEPVDFTANPRCFGMVEVKIP